PAQAGEVDGRVPRAPGRAGAGRRGRGLRLPRRARSAGTAVDAAHGPRVAVPAGPRAPPPVAALPALQPALHLGVRAPVRPRPPVRAGLLSRGSAGRPLPSTGV